jgi:alkaline phosphatase
MTIAGYPARGNPILGLVQAPGASGPTLAADGRPYATISYANGPGFGLHNGEAEDGPPRPVVAGRAQNLAEIDTTAPEFHQQSLVGMRAETHSGEDVALFASGPGADVARGVIDQNEIYHIMRRALGF